VTCWNRGDGGWRILNEIRDGELVILVPDIGHRSKAFGGH
jgi:hypothetical protein